MTRKLFCLAFVGSWLCGQTTTVNVSARQVDFSGALETRVFRTGNTLPASCRKGAVFFKTDAPAGRNVYLCTDQNTWTQAAAGTAVTTVAGLPSPTTPQLAIVTDAANAGTCSAGGGSSIVLCMATGSAWQPVGSGTTDHAALSNLDYASSGHTGFAASNHNHDGVYAPVGHNHDGTYAPIDHNHDGVYQPLLGYTPENAANKGAANGYAPLSGGKVPLANLPVMVGDSGGGGQAGIVPAPAAGDASKCLKGDGTWGTCGTGSGIGTDVVGTDELNDGTDTPQAGEFVRVDTTTPTRFMYSTPAEVLSAIGAAPIDHNHDGVYQPLLGYTPENVANKNAAGGYAGLDSSGRLSRTQLPVMTGATGSSAGQVGAVPAPAAGDQSKCLKGDGTWGDCATGGSGVQIADEGAALPQRPTINMIGAGITCSDDPTNNRTNCSVPGGAPGGSGPAGPLTVASDPAYSGERAVVAGNGIRTTDSGPDGTYTIEVDPTYVAVQAGHNSFTGQNNVNVNRITVTIQNSSTATQQYHLVSLTGNPSRATLAAAGSDRIIGICVSGCGSSGSAVIAIAGIATCSFESGTTAGNFVRISSTQAGKCVDAGTTRPTSGYVGYVLSTNASAGSYDVLLVK